MYIHASYYYEYFTEEMNWFAAKHSLWVTHSETFIMVSSATGSATCKIVTFH